MNSEPTSRSAPSVALPPLALRTQMIRQGDVLLTRGLGKEAKVTAKFSGGQFSHAALFITKTRTFESDGGIVGYRLQPTLWGRLGSEQVQLSRLDGTLDCALYRHPAMGTISEERFRSALESEMRESYGKDYSELYRLIRLASLPKTISPFAAAALKLYESVTVKDSIPGPFCSELVGRLFEKLALPLFDDERRPEHISPNHLAASKLVRVEGAVLKADDLRSLEIAPTRPASIVDSILPIEEFENAAHQLFPAGQDLFANKRRIQRGTEKVFDQLRITFSKIEEGSRDSLASILGLFQSSIEDIIYLLKVSDRLGPPYLRKNAARLSTSCVELASDLLDIRENSSSEERHYDRVRRVMQRLGVFDRSCLRNYTLIKSAELKELLRQTGRSRRWPAVFRFRVQRARRKNLRRTRRTIATMVAREGILESAWGPTD